jgi:hypothetical protein
MYLGSKFASLPGALAPLGFATGARVTIELASIFSAAAGRAPLATAGVGDTSPASSAVSGGNLSYGVFGSRNGTISR